jgi:hypothetical protein
MRITIPPGDEADNLPKSPLSHAQAVAMIERPVGLNKNATRGVKREPVTTAKCIKQNPLNFRTSVGLCSTDFRPAIPCMFRLRFACPHGPLDYRLYLDQGHGFSSSGQPIRLAKFTDTNESLTLPLPLPLTL